MFPALRVWEWRLMCRRCILPSLPPHSSNAHTHTHTGTHTESPNTQTNSYRAWMLICFQNSVLWWWHTCIFVCNATRGGLPFLTSLPSHPPPTPPPVKFLNQGLLSLMLDCMYPSARIYEYENYSLACYANWSIRVYLGFSSIYSHKADTFAGIFVSKMVVNGIIYISTVCLITKVHIVMYSSMYTCSSYNYNARTCMYLDCPES